MISNDYQLEKAKAELATWRARLVELEALLATLPDTIATQVSLHRPATIRQRIRELEKGIQQYETAQRSVLMTAPYV
jgi:hypothetical protein